MSGLSPFSLAGQRVMVTGANTGIGQGICVSIARAGGTVVGVGRSSMNETASLVEAAGGLFKAIHCDLGDPAAAKEMFAQAWSDGPIDGLVNNAGIIRRADAVDFTEADWDAVMDVNLKTVFLLCQAFGKCLLDQGRQGASSTLPRSFPSRAAFALLRIRPRNMGSPV